MSASEQLINFLLLYYRLSENHLLISPYPASSIYEATHTEREKSRITLDINSIEQIVLL